MIYTIIFGIYYIVFALIVPLKKVFKVLYLLHSVVIFSTLFLIKKNEPLITLLIVIVPMILVYFFKNKMLSEKME